MLRRRGKIKFPSPESFMEDEDESVRDLAKLVGSMAEPLEEVFGLSEDPMQCFMSSLVVAKYLRREGFHAHATQGRYLRKHPQIAQMVGSFNASRASWYAKGISAFPLYERHPHRFAARFSESEMDFKSVEALLHTSEDFFVTVNFGGAGRDKNKFMVHPTYRQFYPERSRGAIPPLVMDRVDAVSLRKKYHLALTSPEHASRLRRDEKLLFSLEGDELLSDFELEIKPIVLATYGRFMEKMDAL